MLLVLWILLIIAGLIYKNSKRLTICQILFATLLMAFNNDNPDQYEYLNTFSQVRNSFSYVFSGGNILFKLLLYVFGAFNQYNVALFFICILSFGFLYKGILFYTCKTSYVFSLYLVSPFVIDATQIKNFVAMALWIYISRFLFLAYKEIDVKKNIIYYVIGVLIISFFHFSFIFTIIYISVIYLHKRNIVKFMFGIAGVLIVLAAVQNLESLITFLSQTRISSIIFLLKKMNAYAANYRITSASARKIITIIFYVWIYVFFWILRQFSVSNEKTSKTFFGFTVKLTILSMFTIPLISFSMEIYRMQRNLLCLSYILFALLINGKIIREKFVVSIKNVIPLITGIAISLFYLISDSILWNYESVFKVLFKLK